MSNKILVLGAGLVAGPLVKYLLDQPDFEVIVADIIAEKAESLIGSHSRGESLVLDSRNDANLEKAVPVVDLVVSLLPFTFHPKVAGLCLRHKKNMVTASYVNPQIQAMDKDARQAGITILNEVGLDPGIDHMEAMRIIDKLKADEVKIKSFRSFCGGLPAPEACDNPWNYKFSWSPLGVLHASKSAAVYLERSKIFEISSDDLFDSCREIKIEGLGVFEGYPNRNSLPYIKLYGIDSVETMLRGTLRYPGWCQTMKYVIRLGLLDEEIRDFSGMTYEGLMRALLKIPESQEVKEFMSTFLEIPLDSEILHKLEWLGLWNDDVIPIKRGTAMEVLSDRMYARMSYRSGERDMIVLQHEFIYSRQDGRQEKIISSLVDYGIPDQDSSMARTVGLPAAIGTRLILEGKVKEKGVIIPVKQELYGPILKELENQGISFVTKQIPVNS
ncbi:MAG: saccharopine dehydrogenase NADP-binding domain-containing protein [Candidatus Aminicenantes bacterium]|nr:saccharopine dehydrogenase NADP-binding domain-containing protein [Candidatus Aminicenantes bacterium]